MLFWAGCSLSTGCRTRHRPVTVTSGIFSGHTVHTYVLFPSLGTIQRTAIRCLRTQSRLDITGYPPNHTGPTRRPARPQRPRKGAHQSVKDKRRNPNKFLETIANTQMATGNQGQAKRLHPRSIAYFSSITNGTLTYAAPGQRVVVSHRGAVCNQASAGSVETAPLACCRVILTRYVVERNQSLNVPPKDLQR